MRALVWHHAAPVGRHRSGDAPAADPNEWKNLASNPQYAGTKAELAKTMPTTNHEYIGGKEGATPEKKAKKKLKKAQAGAAK